MDTKCVELCHKLAKDMKEKGVRGRNVTIKLKTVKFVQTTRSVTVDKFLSTGDELAKHALKLLKSEYPPALRLMGVRIGTLDIEPDESGSAPISKFFKAKPLPPQSVAAAAAVSSSSASDAESRASTNALAASSTPLSGGSSSSKAITTAVESPAHSVPSPARSVPSPARSVPPPARSVPSNSVSHIPPRVAQDLRNQSNKIASSAPSRGRGAFSDSTLSDKSDTTDGQESQASPPLHSTSRVDYTKTSLLKRKRSYDRVQQAFDNPASDSEEDICSQGGDSGLREEFGVIDLCSPPPKKRRSSSPPESERTVDSHAKRELFKDFAATSSTSHFSSTSPHPYTTSSSATSSSRSGATSYEKRCLPGSSAKIPTSSLDSANSKYSAPTPTDLESFFNTKVPSKHLEPFISKLPSCKSESSASKPPNSLPSLFSKSLSKRAKRDLSCPVCRKSLGPVANKVLNAHIDSCLGIAACKVSNRGRASTKSRFSGPMDGFVRLS